VIGVPSLGFFVVWFALPTFFPSIRRPLKRRSHAWGFSESPS
jgi:hypothetical protein